MGHSTMKSVIFFLVVLAVYQVAAVPIFGLFGRPGGNAAGFGTGNASPYGASSTGLGVPTHTTVDSLLEVEMATVGAVPSSEVTMPVEMAKALLMANNRNVLYTIPRLLGK